MYKHTILGKEVVISNKAYDALVRKWRVENLETDWAGIWEIYGNCTYCEKYNRSEFNCKGCPFNMFKEDDKGCADLIRAISPKNYPAALQEDFAEWKTKEKATACVSAVEAELKKFKKVIR